MSGHGYQAVFESRGVSLGPPRREVRVISRYVVSAAGRTRSDTGETLDAPSAAMIQEPGGEVWVINLEKAGGVIGKFVAFLQTKLGGPSVPWFAVRYQILPGLPTPVPPGAGVRLTVADESAAPGSETTDLGTKEILGLPCVGSRIVTGEGAARHESEVWTFRESGERALEHYKTPVSESLRTAIRIDSTAPDEALFDVCDAPPWFNRLVGRSRTR